MNPIQQLLCLLLFIALKNNLRSFLIIKIKINIRVSNATIYIYIYTNAKVWIKKRNE